MVVLEKLMLHFGGRDYATIRFMATGLLKLPLSFVICLGGAGVLIGLSPGMRCLRQVPVCIVIRITAVNRITAAMTAFVRSAILFYTTVSSTNSQ